VSSINKVVADFMALVSRPQAMAELSAILQGWYEPQHFITTFQLELLKPAKSGAPALDGVDPQSVYLQCKKMAVLHLVPGEHAILVPRNNKNTNQRVATTMLTWKGDKALIARSYRMAAFMRVELVHRIDTPPEVDAVSGQILSFKMNPLASDRVFRTMDDLQGGFMYIPPDPKFGYPAITFFVHKAHFEKVSQLAQTQDMWRAWFDEMARKTVVRKAYSQQIVPVDEQTSQLLKQEYGAMDELLENDLSRVRLADSRTTALASRDLGQLSAYIADQRKPSQPAIETTSVAVEDHSEPQGSDSNASPNLSIGPTAVLTWDEVEEMFAMCRSANLIANMHEKLLGEFPAAAHARLNQIRDKAASRFGRE